LFIKIIMTLIVGAIESISFKYVWLYKTSKYWWVGMWLLYDCLIICHITCEANKATKVLNTLVNITFLEAWNGLDIFIHMKTPFFFAMSLKFGVFCASESTFQLTYQLYMTWLLALQRKWDGPSTYVCLLCIEHTFTSTSANNMAFKFPKGDFSPNVCCKIIHSSINPYGGQDLEVGSLTMASTKCNNNN
jgi:hypothetical protein